MFTKVEVSNSGGTLTLQLGDTSSGIFVQEITGLDPVKATIQSSSFSNQDGAVFQNSRRDTRNITIQLGLTPDPATSTVRTLRQQLYAFFMPKSTVTMKFFVDDVDDASEDGYQIDGVVESCDTAMFAQEAIVNISIICFDPDFIDPIPVILTGATVSTTAMTDIAYPGTSETGMQLSVQFDREVDNFTVYFSSPGSAVRTMDVVMPGGFLAGDIMNISSEYGQKGAYLVRDGGDSQALYAISPQSFWPKLTPGANSIRIQAFGAAVPTSISYSVRYGAL